MKTYAQRVRELEAEGADTSDAQAVAEVELMDGKIRHGGEPSLIGLARMKKHTPGWGWLRMKAEQRIRKNPSYEKREWELFKDQMIQVEMLPLAERKANAVAWYNALMTVS